VDIKKVPHLDRLEFDKGKGTLIIGPLVTHRTIEQSALVRQQFSLLTELESRLANVRIRNIGTLAGNLCFAEPHSDPGTLLIAYNALVKLQNATRERVVPLQEFFTDFYENVLEKDELLTEIQVPSLTDTFRGTYLRFCPGERPTIAVALLLSWNAGVCDEARIGLGCIGPKPIRLGELEIWLKDKTAPEILGKLEEAEAMATNICEPLEDIWGSASYKRHIVRTLVSRGLAKVCYGEQ
jgi:carbon-monoxide dehydrogenase medium subunit